MVPALQAKDWPLPGVHVILYSGIAGRADGPTVPGVGIFLEIIDVMDVCMMEAITASEGDIRRAHASQ